MSKSETGSLRESRATLLGARVTCRNIRWVKPAKKKGRLVCPECGRSAIEVKGTFGSKAYEHKER